MPEDEKREVPVTRSEETKVYITFATQTHSFKIEEGALDKLEGQFAELQSKIQKGMKQTVDVSKAEWWKESWEAIFKKVTRQELLDKFE